MWRSIRPDRDRTCAVLLVGLALSLPAGAYGQFAEEGEFPPAFALPDETGKVHRLEDLRGTPTILYFTHNMCHYCTQIIGFLKRTRPLHDESELAILTLNVWAADDKFIIRYKEAMGLPFTMLAGKNTQLLRDYEVNYVPIIVFIGRDGKIRHIYHHYVLQGDFEKTTAEIVEE